MQSVLGYQLNPSDNHDNNISLVLRLVASTITPLKKGKHFENISVKSIKSNEDIIQLHTSGFDGFIVNCYSDITCSDNVYIFDRHMATLDEDEAQEQICDEMDRFLFDFEMKGPGRCRIAKLQCFTGIVVGLLDQNEEEIDRFCTEKQLTRVVEWVHELKRNHRLDSRSKLVLRQNCCT
jgi:hypothetical protein